MNNEKDIIQITHYSFFSSIIQRPYKFAFVSDLHLFPNKPIVEGIQSIHPDAVLVGGDFIQSKTNIASGIDFLKTIAQYYPVYCSSGKEHDFDEGLCHRIEETGAVFLRNQSILFKEINIGGLNTLPLSDKTDQEKETLIESDKSWLRYYSSLSGFKLLLCHHPEYYNMFIRDFDVDLVLSGHAHGGQIRLFRRGLWAPGQGWFPKYTSGLYEGRLLVGRGIGNTYQIPRINNKPEILAVNLNT